MMSSGTLLSAACRKNAWIVCHVCCEIIEIICETRSNSTMCFLQWAFCRAGRSCFSAEDIERKSPASASPTKTSPTWAITSPPHQTSAVKSLAASPGASSNVSPSALLANQKARPPTEEQAHWITNSRGQSSWERSLLSLHFQHGLWQAERPRWVVNCTALKEDTSGRAPLWIEIIALSGQKSHLITSLTLNCCSIGGGGNSYEEMFHASGIVGLALVVKTLQNILMM